MRFFNLERFNSRADEVGQLIKLDPSTPDDPFVWGVPIPPLYSGDYGGMWATSRSGSRFKWRLDHTDWHYPAALASYWADVPTEQAILAPGWPSSYTDEGLYIARRRYFGCIQRTAWNSGPNTGFRRSSCFAMPVKSRLNILSRRIISRPL